MLRCTLQTPEWTSRLPPQGRARRGQSHRGQWWMRYWRGHPGRGREDTRSQKPGPNCQQVRVSSLACPLSKKTFGRHLYLEWWVRDHAGEENTRGGGKGKESKKGKGGGRETDFSARSTVYVFGKTIKNCTITKVPSSGPGCRKCRWSPCFSTLKYIRFWVKSGCNNKYTSGTERATIKSLPGPIGPLGMSPEIRGRGGASSLKMNFAGLALSAQGFPGKSHPPESTLEPCGQQSHQVRSQRSTYVLCTQVLYVSFRRYSLQRWRLKKKKRQVAPLFLSSSTLRLHNKSKVMFPHKQYPSKRTPFWSLRTHGNRPEIMTPFL